MFVKFDALQNRVNLVYFYHKSNVPATGQKGKKKMKKIGENIEYVSFVFGSMAYVTVNIYEGKTFEECLKLRSPDIDGYVKNGKFVKV